MTTTATPTMETFFKSGHDMRESVPLLSIIQGTTQRILFIIVCSCSCNVCNKNYKPSILIICGTFVVGKYLRVLLHSSIFMKVSINSIIQCHNSGLFSSTLSKMLFLVECQIIIKMSESALSRKKFQFRVKEIDRNASIGLALSILRFGIGGKCKYGQ